MHDRTNIVVDLDQTSTPEIVDTQIGLLVGLIFACNLALSQAPVNILSIKQGLPKSQIYDIVQDSSGFIWIGTRDGLVKYDGHSPQVYRSGDGGISFNYIFDLLLDKQHRLWMTSNADYQGAAYLEFHTGQFHQINKSKYPALAHDGIIAVAEDVSGQIALLTRDFQLSLVSTDLDSITTINLHSYLPDTTSTITSYEILADAIQPGVFWIVGLNSIFRFNSLSKDLDLILKGHRGNPTSLLIDPQNHSILWVGLENYGGLLKINTQNWDDIEYFSTHGKQQVTGSNFDAIGSRFNVYEMQSKSEDELYIATADRGLGVFNRHTGQFNFEQHHTDALEDDFVRTLLVNLEGEVWVGADKSGLYYLRPERSRIKLRLFRDNILNRSQFRMTDILAVDNETFIMTFYNYPEVWIWHREDNTFEKIEFEDKELYANRVFSWQKQLFLATNRGVKRLQLSEKSIVDDNLLFKDAESSLINNLLQDSSEIWFVDWGVGLLHHRHGNTVLYQGGNEQGLRHTWTHDLIYGPDGQLWLGQQNGLYTLDREGGEITTLAHREELSGFVSPNFKALVFDHLERLWVGNFGGAIACYDPLSRKVRYHMDVSKGLPSNRIYDLIVDDDGFVWVWTSDGLCSFFPSEDFDKIRVKYYPETKFFPVDRQGIWFIKLDSGEIFFGVSGGFAYFDPASVRATNEDELDAPIVTDFSVLNGNARINLPGVLDQPIQLKPRQNFFSISFSAPKSGYSKQQKFQYKLAGLDPSWVQSEDLRTVTYTDLRPGTYWFQAKVGDQNGIWSEASEPLTIILAAPWYATNLAKVIWVLLFGGILYLTNRILIFRERLRNQLAMQKLESKNLRALDAAKSNFFTQISHEFRTPLTVILGMASKLRQKLNGQTQDLTGVDAIERNGKLLLKQINQILDLSKLKSDTISLEMVQSDVVFYLRYLTEAFEAYAAGKNIDLRFAAQIPRLSMDFDPLRLKDIFTNLLSNAIKFTEDGGRIDIMLSTATVNDSQYFLLSIADTGVGIHPDDLEKIFDPYYQTKEGLNHQGTGLGLATSKQWVQAMGGQITVDSKKNSGSVFEITLPITREAKLSAIAENKVTASDHDIETSKSASLVASEKPIVLVVEDNQDVLSYIASCLSDRYELLFAHDGQQGIEIAIQSVPDLIISDVMMPVKDGYELCAYIKSHEVSDHIPIILLTAKATQDEKRIGLSIGVDAYVTKPFDEQELLIRVGGLISQRKKLQEKYGRSPSERNVKDTGGPDLQDQFLDRIQSFVEQHIQEDFSVEELAEHMRMSRVQLYRKVKAISGQSVSKYIRLIRLYKARKMLRTSSLSISEVAYEVGFSDPSYFSKAFKETFANSPSELRD